jgi:hypothetical protein
MQSFFAVNASLLWPNCVSCLFFLFLLTTSGVYCNCLLIKVDRLDVRVAGAALVVFLRR